MEIENRTRKNVITRILCILMSFFMIFTTLSVIAFAGDDKDFVVIEGYCGKEGDNLKYTLYKNKKLVISGTGEMADYEKEASPFSNIKFDMLVIEPGATSIGKYAFYNCADLEAFEVGKQVAVVDRTAFEGCNNVGYVCFGNMEVDVSELALPEDVIYFCFKDSGVHKFAKENNKNYVLIDDEESYLITEETENLSWTLNKITGVLTVNGSASLSELNTDALPWDAYKIYIKEIVFEEGITDITADYSAYSNLEAITVPSSVNALEDSVLSGNGKLEKIVIYNPLCTFEKNADTKVTAVIYGYDYSSAKAFANENSLSFEIIECLHTKTSEHEAVEPTCAAFGYTAGVFCETCKIYISGHEQIDKAEHKWTDATCTDPKTCSECKETEGEPLGHKWTDATCTEAKTCSVCGETEGKALGHKEEIIKGKKPTCTAKGITDGKKCTVCKTVTVEQKEIPAAGHKWKDATCYEPKTCTECKITTGSALVHNWQVADCTQPRTCSLCKKTEGEALGHVWTEATCAKAKTCSRCKATDGDALPHTIEILPRKAATCTEEGLTEGKRCSVCGYVINVQRATPAFGHIDIDVQGKAATCTEKGHTAGKSCSLCGEITSGHKEIAALGHQWKEADCVNPKTCTVCGAVDGEAKGHKTVTLPSKKPTCTETGLTSGKKCSVCGIIIENQLVIVELGHEEVIVAEGKEPTCTKKGYTETVKCSVCDTVTEESVELDAYGHEWKEATCQSPKTCAVCGLKEGKVGDHKIVAVPAVAATYTKSGKTAGKKCEYCGKVTVKQKTVARKKLKKASGLKVKSFTSTSVTLTWKKTTGADSYKVYYSTDGKKWKSVKVKKNTATVKKLTSGKQYQFKVRAFAGKYYGAASKIVKKTTKVKKPVLSSVKSSKKKTAAVSWKAVERANGYIVEYSTSNKFTKKTTKTLKIKKAKAVKATLKNLKSGKKYYVRVKAYKTVNKKAVYGSYSNVKSVKIK